MSNLLSRFYLFSKLSTSLFLFVILIILSYLFIRSYLDLNTSVNNVSSEKINLRLSELSTLIEKNSSNINIVKNLVINNQQSFKNIENSISDNKKYELNNNVMVQLKQLSEKNDALESKVASLLLKIDNLNSSSQLSTKNNKSSLPIENFVNLIKFKLENGSNYTEEVKLLQNLPLNQNQYSHIEKLSILANKNFLGLNKLHKNFDLISSDYLNYYYLKKNKNNFMKYFLNLVTIRPNLNKSIKDRNIKSLVLAKEKLSQNDLEESVAQLLTVYDVDIFFETWIKEAQYYIEVNNILNKIAK